MLALSMAVAIAAGWLLSACSLECIQPPGAAVDGYAGAQVHTWYDVDGDGQQDPGEEPLPWVAIQMSHERSITDNDGQGALVVFKPGCACRCWADEVLAMRVPPGHRATTPTELNLSGQDLSYAFGLQIEEGVRLLSFPGEPDWFRAFLNWGLDLRKFHYDSQRGHLSISFDTPGDVDKYQLYRDVFDVVSTVKDLENVTIQQVEIMMLPSNEVVTCDLSAVERAIGMSFQEMVANYCLENQ
jgi:hypothetical protein